MKFVAANRGNRRRLGFQLFCSGRDLVPVNQKTGSGKTHTFLLPIFQKLNEDEDHVQVVISGTKP